MSTSGAQLLTRNRYTITVYRRSREANGIDLVYFRLSIGGTPGPSFTLPRTIFDDLNRDLGMRATSPEATEWESTPIGATTPGQEDR
jgi:hypothetical protein